MRVYESIQIPSYPNLIIDCDMNPIPSQQSWFRCNFDQIFIKIDQFRSIIWQIWIDLAIWIDYIAQA